MTTSLFSSPFLHCAILCFADIPVGSYIRDLAQHRSPSSWMRNLPYSMFLRSAVLIYLKTITVSDPVALRNFSHLVRLRSAVLIYSIPNTVSDPFALRNFSHLMILRFAVLIYPIPNTAPHLLPLRNDRDAHLSIHPFSFITCAQSGASRN